MKRALVAILTALVIILSCTAAVAAAPVCTAFLSAGAPIPPWEQPGTILCFHAGTYTHDSVAITSNNVTYMAAPGETAYLVATGQQTLTFYGHDVTVAGLDIDNGGQAGIIAPAIELRG